MRFFYFFPPLLCPVVKKEVAAAAGLAKQVHRTIPLGKRRISSEAAFFIFSLPPSPPARTERVRSGGYPLPEGEEIRKKFQ